MADRLFGIETEYGFSGVNAAGAPAQRETLALEFMDCASAELPHLRGRSHHDLFLQNGSRLYIDAGAHPELATPECLDPWDAVRYVRAGQRIVSRVAAKLESGFLDTRVLIFCANVDYGAHTSWGCHESYHHRTIHRQMAEQLVPHLVSRVVFTGAGGFNPASAGVEFTLSPRAAFIGAVETQDTVTHRGIVNTRQEPLGGANRLHIIFGESLCSDVALWLKVGTTALVVAMIDHGATPGADVQLLAPLRAVRAFTGDPECRATAPLVRGGPASAVAIQRHYLAQAEAHRDAAFMPPWTGEVCARWRETLDLIERGPDAVTGRLDWATKRALFMAHAARRGFKWQSIPGWTARADEAAESGPETAAPSSWQKTALGEFFRLRQQLFEIDMRFGQLGGTGIFETLAGAGLLDHVVEGVSDADIERAVRHPPARGRARVRGEAIARLAGSGDRHLCDWTGIWNETTGAALHLFDPFEQEERWTSRA